MMTDEPRPSFYDLLRELKRREARVARYDDMLEHAAECDDFAAEIEADAMRVYGEPVLACEFLMTASCIDRWAVRELREAMGEGFGKGPRIPFMHSPRFRRHCEVRMVFRCSPEQAEIIQQALCTAQNMTGKEMPADNLELICSGFTAGVASSGPTPSNN